jgi:hypothetical protein
MDTVTAVKAVRQPKPLPRPNSDFYRTDLLNAEERAILQRVRTFTRRGRIGPCPWQ